MLVKDIYLDDGAFEKAVADYKQLTADMKSLRQRISGLLSGLREGFDTPAGRAFFESCGANLLKPLDDQLLVLEHVSANLSNAKSKYESVFAEYKRLNSAINNV